MALRVTTAAALIALLVPAAALAARQPTRAERAAITRAMTFPGIPRACLPLKIRVSSRNARFAVAWYRGGDRCGTVVGNGVSILRRSTPSRWRTVLVGSALDCDGDGKVPPAVMRDLLGKACG